MEKKSAIAIASGLFQSYPSVNEFHITTDGSGFIAKHDAEAHADALNKKEPVVITVTREEAEASSEDDSNTKAIEAATQKVEKLTKKLETAKPEKKEAIQKELETAQEELAALTAEND